MLSSLCSCVAENSCLGSLRGGHGLVVDRAGVLPWTSAHPVLRDPFGFEAAPTTLAADAQCAFQGQPGLFCFAHDALDGSPRDRRLVFRSQRLEIINDLRINVGDLLKQQFDIYERILAPSTLKSYKRVLNKVLLGQWGDTLLTDLTPAALRTWIVDLSLKATSVRQVLIPLRGALELAINDDLIDSNPLDRVKLQKTLDRDAYKAEYEVDPFSAQEIAAILGAAQGQARNVFQFAFYTGMRPSEYIALRWESIDWAGFKAKVERSRVMGESREELKTRAGRRLVDLRRGAVEALVAQKQHSFLAGGLVFFDPATGQGWDNTQRLSLFWAAMIKKAQVRYRNPYQTRHTFASTLLSTGANAMYVAKQMGHTDTTMITRTYGRWVEQEGGVLPDQYCKMTDGLKAGAA